MLHARIQEFLSGGPGQSDKKKALKTLFIFFWPQLILQNSNGKFQRNLTFFKVPEGVQHFPGGSNYFQGGGGSNCIFPIETHITCDFPGGSGPPVPPSGSALVLLFWGSVYKQTNLPQKVACINHFCILMD